MFLQWIVIGSPAVPVAHVPEFDEGMSDFGDEDYNHLPGVLRVERTKEELALALKASVVQLWKKRRLR